MIAPEREFLQAWQDLHYPPGPEMPEEPQPVQVAQAPIEGPGGAAFGVFPAMRSAARPGVKSEAAAMLPADVAAGAAKGTITGAVGLPGDIESLIRGVRGIFQRGGDQGKLDAFLAGMEENTILPTSEDVSKWLDANVGPVVPPGAPMAKQRAGVAGAGQFVGEMVSGPGTLVKGAKAGGRAAKATVKFVKPKVGEMLSDYMSRSGLTPELMAFHGTPARFAPEEGAPLGRFRSEKIGTGEGAQAYGYGLYFAEAPEVAQGYRIGLSNPRPFLTQELENVLPDTFQGKAPDWADAIASGKTFSDLLATVKLPWQKTLLRQNKPQLEKLIADAQSGGSLYTVDIPDEMIGKMLDYDKPLSSQPAELQSKLKAVVDAEVGPGVWESWIKNEPDFRNLKDDLFDNKTDAEVSALLREAGVPGVRYLDRQSRPTNIMDKRLQGLFEKHNGDIEKTVNEYMRSIYDTPKVKEKIRADVMKQLETPITRNIVVFPGEEDKVKILKVE